MMAMDDVIYIALLLGCIGFGSIYRHMSNERINRKRWIGSAFGFLLIVLVSGFHVVHVMFTFAVSTLIILAFHVRQAHILTFLFMFGYLLFFRMTDYFDLPTPPGHTNLVQMIFTLKMVGLAFERNTAAKELILENQKKFSSDDDRNISAIKKAYLEDILDLNVEDVFHYCFSYVAVLTGPYYTYRTYRDYFTARYWQFVNCELLMMQRLKWVAVYAAFFLSCSYIWPINYALSDEFYFERSFLYRLWYILPSFFVFRMRIYIGLTLSECVCIMSGFGAYPQPFRSRPGGGPREVVALDRPIAEAQFDFETIHNFDAQTTESSLTIREAMRSYQMCTQYWLATVVYQRFPSKKLRTVATLVVSAFWQGSYPGYFLSMLGVPLYLPVETLWDSLMRQKAVGTRRQVMDGLFWVSKTFVASYLGMAFLLMTTEKIMYYYQSVYYIGYVWGVGVYLVGLLVHVQSRFVGKPKAAGRAGTPAVPAAKTGPPRATTPAPVPLPPVPSKAVPEPPPSAPPPPVSPAQPPPPAPEANPPPQSPPPEEPRPATPEPPPPPPTVIEPQPEPEPSPEPEKPKQE